MSQIELKDLDIFRGLQTEELTKLSGLARSVSYKRGDSLVEESEQGDGFFLILEGRVDVKVSVPGSDQGEVIATLSAGEVVGDVVLVGRTRRSADVVAKDDVKVLMWPKARLLSLFEQDHHIGYCVMSNLASLLADRLTAMNMVLRNTIASPRTVIL